MSETQARFSFPDYLLGDDLCVDAREAAEPRPGVARSLERRGRHVTGAALQLHPLLRPATVKALERLLARRTRLVSAGEHLAEYGDDGEPAVYFQTSGRFKLVEIAGERRREVGRYRPAMWIGLPRLLAAWDATRRPAARWPSGLSLHAVALGPAEAGCIPLTDMRALMEQHDDLRRFVEQQVAIRFARRDRMMALLAGSQILRFLDESDAEYLLQLGALKRMPATAVAGEGPPYMRAGVPSGRVAMVVAGDAKAFLPAGEGGGQRYVGTCAAGELVGHEALADGRRGTEAQAPPDEAPRHTQIELLPGCEVLELDWHAFRWVVDDTRPVWQRVVRVLEGRVSGHSLPMPRVVSVLAARPGLGTSALAYGTAAALGEGLDAGGRACVVDLQGQQNYEAHWKRLGFGVEDHDEPFQGGRRRQRENRVAYRRLVVPAGARGWPGRLEVLWPVSTENDDADDLIELLQCREDVRHIVLGGHTAHLHRSPAAHELVERLNGRSDLVLCVTDDPTEPYPISREEPRRLVWVYRMNERYRAAERAAAAESRLPWRERFPMRLFGAAEAAGEERAEPLRRVVRVPDDAEGARLFAEGRLLELLEAPEERYALARAFRRLARTATGRTVGLALGGGGAWGFAHVALIRKLRAAGLPVDYIAGTSFGSVVGGLYAAGGMAALERLLAENDAAGERRLLRAATSGPLSRAMFAGMASGTYVERFVDEHIARVPGSAASLGLTEIPFYPVATNLGTHAEQSDFRAPIGLGVRMSGSLPPVFSPMSRRGRFIVDGAFVANVPSRLVREMGADFVVASNVVPPAPSEAPDRPPETLRRRAARHVLARLESSVRGVYVLAWKAGRDQGELFADVNLDLRPTGCSLVEFWRGREIVAQIEARHFGGDEAERIREAWARHRPA